MKELKFRQAIKPYGEMTSPWWHYWGYLDGKHFTMPLSRIEGDDRPSQQYTGKGENGEEIYA